jgi:hypothetical protein
VVGTIQDFIRAEYNRTMAGQAFQRNRLVIHCPVNLVWTWPCRAASISWFVSRITAQAVAARASRLRKRATGSIGMEAGATRQGARQSTAPFRRGPLENQARLHAVSDLQKKKTRSLRERVCCMGNEGLVRTYREAVLKDMFFTLAAVQASMTLMIRPCTALSSGRMFTMNSLPDESAAALSDTN